MLPARTGGYCLEIGFAEQSIQDINQDRINGGTEQDSHNNADQGKDQKSPAKVFLVFIYITAEGLNQHQDETCNRQAEQENREQILAQRHGCIKRWLGLGWLLVLGLLVLGLLVLRLLVGRRWWWWSDGLDWCRSSSCSSWSGSRGRSGSGGRCQGSPAALTKLCIIRVFRTTIWTIHRRTSLE